MKNSLQTIFTVLLSFLLFYTGETIANERDIVEVPDLATLRSEGLADGTVYRVTGEIILTHQNGNRNQKYFQDDTGAILVDDSDGIITTSYEKYDGITGLTGELSFYMEMLQLVPVEDPGDPVSSGNVVEPLEIQLADIAPDHQAMLIIVRGVLFGTPDDKANFAPSTSYDIYDESGIGVLRTPHVNAGLDYFGTPIPSTERDIVSVVNQFQTTMQIMPRSLADFIAAGTFNVTFIITDEDDAPIDDAVITFDGQEMDPGQYEFEDIAVGTYNYTVARAGYKTASGSILVEGDITHTVILVEFDEDNMVTEYPWMPEFEGTDFPAGWRHYTLGDAGAWEISDGQLYHRDTQQDQMADSWLITPQIELPGNENMLLSFIEKNQFMSEYGYSGVLISTGSGNPNHGHFVELYESDDNIGIVEPKETMLGLGDYVGELVYIAFNYSGEFAHRWWVYDLMIDYVPEAIEVPNIAAFKDQTISPDLIYRITGEVIITCLQTAYRGQFYVQDETGALLVDDAPGIVTTEYQLYDGITGFTGNLGVFQNMLQILPTEDPGDATSHENTVEPVEITLSDIEYDSDEIPFDDQGMLVIVRKVSFDLENSPADFMHNQSYFIYDDTGDGLIRTPNSADLFDYFGTPVPDTSKDIIGVLHQRFEVVRLQPRMLADFMDPEPVQVITPEIAEVNVYPNPASSQINVESLGSKIDMVSIYNLSGQLIREINAGGANIITLDVNGFNQGMYLLRIITDEKVLTRKIQITR